MDLRSLEETRDQVCWILPHPALLPLYCLMVTQNPLSVSVTVQVIHGQQPLLIVAFKDLFLLPCFLTSYLIKPFSTLHKAHPNCHLLTQYSSFIPSFSCLEILFFHTHFFLFLSYVSFSSFPSSVNWQSCLVGLISITPHLVIFILLSCTISHPSCVNLTKVSTSSFCSFLLTPSLLKSESHPTKEKKKSEAIWILILNYFIQNGAR